ncbi:MAG TPA: 1-(5-phosphoribosyl)-5-[(5-phosphoribosylamino)methylideneamino]imidazole-4-carboxamide isomerase [Pirellulaceae bacterium]|nr:1-(5-phosphoribosyl)-5-[(5-phosphoribosylamino)methylideneamino]imidazole-4-carboxamide isomerase [Pirellulaceae bacterium]HMO92006.1 1-(5-phosphoribosyl)-5-[(5-phosphoribosylamino)methylideneamino]imidazole-4-carboxamide isomerase [Pirellulaceae bacterium]HMP68805.1 1-(5-phosphoribosyl)-5-[(5-phosphoribosylamino)methylideneamino]imidazole-4-carboxamide isomerase [Pirellulaceae bacterium]
MQIWPAIDIRDGNCVRLIRGDFEQETIYNSNPVDVAQRFYDDGATCLHVVDLDGARTGRPVNHEVILAIANKVPDLTIEVGGGIRDEDAIATYLSSGIARVVLGTKAILDPTWFRLLVQRNAGRIVLGLDARDGQAAIAGWGESSAISAYDLARDFSDIPLAAIVFTDIEMDGMLSGPNFAAMQRMQQATAIPIICSGGVTTVHDVQQLAKMGVAGCIIGRALYTGKITLREALVASRG